MKSNAPKRKIFDAVDLLTEDTSVQIDSTGNGVVSILISKIKAFHDHPFHRVCQVKCVSSLFPLFLVA